MSSLVGQCVRLLAYVQGKAFARNPERSRAAYGLRRDAMLAALEKEMPAGVNWTIPASSFCLWLTLPPGLSAQEVARRAAVNGVVVARGDAFVQADSDNAFRLMFTSNEPERLAEGIRRLAHTIKSLLHEIELARVPGGDDWFIR